MVIYIKSDLEFILKQIKISEDHALYEQSGGTLGKALFGAGGSIPTYNLRRYLQQPVEPGTGCRR
jgi:hypothetical protein